MKAKHGNTPQPWRYLIGSASILVVQLGIIALVMVPYLFLDEMGALRGIGYLTDLIRKFVT